MVKIEYLRDYDYSNDRLIVGDIDQREKSYVILLQKKLNEVAMLLNEEVKLRIQRDNEFSKRIEIAEKKAADEIKNADSEEKKDTEKEV